MTANKSASEYVNQNTFCSTPTGKNESQTDSKNGSEQLKVRVEKPKHSWKQTTETVACHPPELAELLRSRVSIPHSEWKTLEELVGREEVREKRRIRISRAVASQWGQFVIKASKNMANAVINN